MWNCGSKWKGIISIFECKKTIVVLDVKKKKTCFLIGIFKRFGFLWNCLLVMKGKHSFWSIAILKKFDQKKKCPKKRFGSYISVFSKEGWLKFFFNSGMTPFLVLSLISYLFWLILKLKKKKTENLFFYLLFYVF